MRNFNNIEYVPVTSATVQTKGNQRRIEPGSHRGAEFISPADVQSPTAAIERAPW